MVQESRRRIEQTKSELQSIEYNETTPLFLYLESLLIKVGQQINTGFTIAIHCPVSSFYFTCALFCLEMVRDQSLQIMVTRQNTAKTFTMPLICLGFLSITLKTKLHYGSIKIIFLLQDPIEIPLATSTLCSKVQYYFSHCYLLVSKMSQVSPINFTGHKQPLVCTLNQIQSFLALFHAKNNA